MLIYSRCRIILGDILTWIYVLVLTVTLGGELVDTRMYIRVGDQALISPNGPTTVD